MTWLDRRRRRNRCAGATVASVDTLEPRTQLTSYLPPSGDADVFLRDGDLIVENSQGTEVFVEGGRVYAQPRSHFTDRFSVRKRRFLWEPRDGDEAQAISLANSHYPTRGGIPIHVVSEGSGKYLVTYPIRAERFFQSGRPRVRVDLERRTVDFLPASGGRSRPVEFTDLELQDGWWNDLPS